MISDTKDAAATSQTVLVVDDEESIRLVLAKTLEKYGLRVLVAPNGKVAQQILLSETVNVVISDIRMPEMDGVALTEFIKCTTQVPVILMTGFSEILETQAAYALGADEFFAKPIDRDELYEAVQRCLRRTEKVGTADETDFCRLSIEDFTSGKQIQYSIFIRLSESKFLKIAHGGEDLAVERIRALKAKGVHFLYLLKEDFKKYVGFNLSLTTAIRHSKAVAKEKKLNLIKHTGEILLEQVHHEDVDDQTFTSAVSFVETSVAVLYDDREILDLLSVLNNHADHLYAHSVGVSLYSVMLARAVHWTLPTNLFKVAVGGLLHDVGKKEFDRELLLKSRRHWTPEDVKSYESHPQRGTEILKQIKSVPADVLQIVKEHHEHQLGTGFPSYLRGSHIHPMAKLIAVANAFCDRIIKNPDSPGMEPKAALQDMVTFCADQFDPSFFSALMRLCKFIPPENFKMRGSLSDD